MIYRLTDNQCAEIISWHKHYYMGNVRECSDICSPAGLHKSRLNYNIAEITNDNNSAWLFKLISNSLKEEFPNNRVENKPFFYLHKFDKGDKFTRHVDRDRQNDWIKIVGGILNSGFEGGKLLTYNPDGELATKAGELYSMDASTPHEVTEVLHGSRFSFVFFLTAEELGISKSIL